MQHQLTCPAHSRIPNPEDSSPHTHHKIRNMGYRRPGALRLARTDVLPKRTIRARGLRPNQTNLPRKSQTLGSRAPAPSKPRHRHRAGGQ